jgi:hypothetical protein
MLGSALESDVGIAQEGSMEPSLADSDMHNHLGVRKLVWRI